MSDTTTPARSTTAALLTCGVAAGALFVVGSLLHAVARDGFDFRRHPLSVLSNGDLGWVQIAIFVVSGLLFVAMAVGVRQTLRSGRGATWGPWLVGVVGVGMVASGVFVADPGQGFPPEPGTPPGRPDTLSWHGGLHFATSGLAFLALVALCFVFARRSAATGQRGWAAYSVTTGVIFLAAWVALLARPESDAATIAFTATMLHAVTWLSLMAGRLRPGWAG